MAALLPVVKADAEAVKVVVEVVKAACLAVVAVLAVKAACFAVVTVLVVTKPVAVLRAAAVWSVVRTASSLAAA